MGKMTIQERTEWGPSRDMADRARKRTRPMTLLERVRLFVGIGQHEKSSDLPIQDTSGSYLSEEQLHPSRPKNVIDLPQNDRAS